MLKDKAEKKPWNLSTNNEATFYQEDVNILIKRIVEVDEIIFQVTSSYSNPIVVTFDVRSLKEEAAPYLEDLKVSFHELKLEEYQIHTPFFWPAPLPFPDHFAHLK